jgi:hypothetical protein
MSKERARIRKLMSQPYHAWENEPQPDLVIDQPERVKSLRGQDVYTLFQLTHGASDSRCFIGHFATKAAALENVRIGDFAFWEIWHGDLLVTYRRD